MTRRVTDLHDARAMKAMGLPLTTPVEEGGDLPEQQCKLIKSVLRAADACRSAVFAYIANPNASTYAALKRKHAKLGREIAKIPEPNWNEEPDGPRFTNPADAVVHGIVGPRCYTAFEQWAEIIATLDSGGEFVGELTPWPTETDKAAP
jgi:hypothetical protein